MLIAAIITDYERALLDRIRSDAQYRYLIYPLSLLPATAESEAQTMAVYDNAQRIKEGKKPLPLSEIAAELERHRQVQAGYRAAYKAKGYREPYTYGKGKVKVLYEVIEGGKAMENTDEQ